MRYLVYLLKCLGCKNEVYSRYVDDIDVINRSIERMVKVCPVAGHMVNKSDDGMIADENKNEDEITM